MSALLSEDVELQYNVHQPRPHQAAAVAALLDAIGDGGRAQVIHACGAGKTRTACMFTQQVRARSVLVVVPTLALLAQTMIEWGHQYAGALEFRGVCSDERVRPDQLRFDGQGGVLGDHHDITSFLTDHRYPDRTRVVFATYHSTPKIARAVPFARRLDWEGFDLIVFDEAHRLVGGEESKFTTGLFDELIPAKRRVFMTATPRLTTAGLGSDKRVVSMDDESLFGKVAHEYTFGQAISEGRLSPYRVTALGIDPDDLPGLDLTGFSSNKEAVEALRHHAGMYAAARMMHAEDLKRMVSFHSSIKRCTQFVDDLKTLNRRRIPGAHVRDLRALAIHSEMRAEERKRVMAMLGPTHDLPVLVANPKLLTEGIDVPALDGVVFVDPRESPVDMVQAVGRALRTAPGKKIGHIVVPVIMRPGEDPATATARGGFETLWQVLATLSDMDGNLSSWIDSQATNWTGTSLPDVFDIQLPDTLGEAEERMLLTAKLQLVHQVATVPGQSEILVKCQCGCGYNTTSIRLS